jgi:hypothetical protein
MSFRNILISFLMCITWSILRADLVFSCLIGEQEYTKRNTQVKKKHEKAIPENRQMSYFEEFDINLACFKEFDLHVSDKPENIRTKALVKKKIKKHKQEQITSKIKLEKKQPKAPLNQLQKPISEIIGPKTLRCLRKLDHEELRDLVQTKCIVLNDMKISLLSVLDEVTVKELNDPNSLPFCALLDEIIQPPPSRIGFAGKLRSEIGNYYLYQNHLVIEGTVLKISFTRDKSTSKGSVLSGEGSPL